MNKGTELEALINFLQHNIALGKGTDKEFLSERGVLELQALEIALASLIAEPAIHLAQTSEKMHGGRVHYECGRDYSKARSYYATPPSFRALEAALEQAQRHAALTDAERQAYVGLCNDRDKRIAELQEQRDCWVERAKELGAKADKLEARQLSIPAGWKIVPTTATPSMARAGAAAAREYMTETGGNSPFVIYESMVLAAPSAELEARQLSVKLPNRLQPGADGPDDWYLHSDPDGEYMKADDVIEAIRAAGGHVEGSE